VADAHGPCPGEGARHALELAAEQLNGRSGQAVKAHRDAGYVWMPKA